MSTAPADAVPAARIKPRLRGVSHQIGAAVAALAGLALVLSTDTSTTAASGRRARVAG